MRSFWLVWNAVLVGNNATIYYYTHNTSNGVCLIVNVICIVALLSIGDK